MGLAPHGARLILSSGELEMKIELKPGIYWVGAIDWNIRDFHGYSTHKGSTYNAYLVMGGK